MSGTLLQWQNKQDETREIFEISSSFDVGAAPIPRAFVRDSESGL
jgi:hypothetical protein